MKHLVVASDLFKPSRGGTETVTENMAIQMVKAGWRVTVVSPSTKGMHVPKVVHDDAGYDVLRVRSIGIPIQKDLRFAHRAKQEVYEYFDKPENQPDVIHVNNVFPSSKLLLKYGRKHDIPVVAGAHLMPESFTVGLRKLGGLHRFFDGVGWRLIARFYNQASLVVSPTQTGVDYLEAHGLKIPTKVISNGIDLHTNEPLKLSDQKRAKLRSELGLTAQYIVLYAGRLGVEKRVDVIITSIALLQERFDVQLLLIGDGNARKKLEKLAKKLGLKNKVVFTGYVQELYAKREYMALADIFAIASPVELQSIVTLEAMAAGLPVLACDEGALPELAQHGVNGGTFRDGDSVELARLIGGLLHDPVKLKKYGEASETIIQQHDMHDTWRQYDEMYRDLLQK